MIDERLDPRASTGDIAAGDQPEHLANDAREQREAELVRRLWSRITEQKTKDLLRVFASFDRPFSLSEVAEQMERDYSAVKAQKFRLGRSEKRLNDELGIGLFESQEWDGSQYVYRMSPGVREAIRRSADES